MPIVSLITAYDKDESPEVQTEQYNRVKELATKFQTLGYTMRVGNMDGAEKAAREVYESTPELMEVHLPWEGFGSKPGEKKENFKEVILKKESLDFAIEQASSAMERNVGKPAIQKLYARAGSQIYGKDLSTKTDIVIFDASSKDNKINAQVEVALKIAEIAKIEPINLRDQGQYSRLSESLDASISFEKEAKRASEEIPFEIEDTNEILSPVVYTAERFDNIIGEAYANRKPTNGYFEPVEERLTLAAIQAIIDDPRKIYVDSFDNEGIEEEIAPIYGDCDQRLEATNEIPDEYSVASESFKRTPEGELAREDYITRKDAFKADIESDERAPETFTELTALAKQYNLELDYSCGGCSECLENAQDMENAYAEDRAHEDGISHFDYENDRFHDVVDEQESQNELEERLNSREELVRNEFEATAHSIRENGLYRAVRSDPVISHAQRIVQALEVSVEKPMIAVPYIDTLAREAIGKVSEPELKEIYKNLKSVTENLANVNVYTKVDAIQYIQESVKHTIEEKVEAQSENTESHGEIAALEKLATKCSKMTSENFEEKISKLTKKETDLVAFSTRNILSPAYNAAVTEFIETAKEHNIEKEAKKEKELTAVGGR